MIDLRGETLAQYLDRRKKELKSQISALRGQLDPREAELAQIEKMEELLAIAPAAGLTDLASGAQLGPSDVQVEMTIKEMILSALRDHFIENGASPTDLRDYMRSAYDRDVDRNSISPQLSRLREEGMVDMLNSGKWKLSRHAIGILRYGGATRLRDLR
jgi:DNA-binding transcriptional ArsR family regulator